MVLTVSDRANATTRRSRKRHPLLVPTVSQKTRARLYLDASKHPACEGMEEQEVRAFIESKVNSFLSKQPWWYGHTDDTKHHAVQRQYKARKEKEHLAALAQTTAIRQQEGGLERAHILEWKQPSTSVGAWT